MTINVRKKISQGKRGKGLSVEAKVERKATTTCAAKALLLLCLADEIYVNLQHYS